MSVRPSAVAVVLAAGGGTRMKSDLPKVLHRIAGRPLLAHAVAAARGAEPEHLVVVVRHQRERVASFLAESVADAVVADQDDVPGTGRAVECALDALEAHLGEFGEQRRTVVVTAGDTPLLTPATIAALRKRHEESGALATVLTAHLEDPSGYGRVLRAPDGAVTGVVEEKDATDAQRAITEINTGVYAFDLATLRRTLTRVGTDNAQNEKYLPDVVGILVADGAKVAAQIVDDPRETDGVNDRLQLSRAGKELNRRIVESWMREGVTVVDPDTTWIDADVTLAQDVTLQPGVQLVGATTIETGAVVGPDSTLTNVQVGQRANVVRVHAKDAVIGAGADVGPFTYLRPGTVIGVDGKAGAFVEVKNAVLGTGTKIPHLSYVGDADIGDGTNIGCSSVFVNYDGLKKQRSTVGDHVRIGSDTMIVAPVTIGDGAYTAAGSVVRKDVPAGALAMSVAPQRNIEGWVEAKRPGTTSAQAAAAARPEPNPAGEDRTTHNEES